MLSPIPPRQRSSVVRICFQEIVMSTGVAEPSASQRKLPLRMRPDLTIHPLVYRGRRQWGIKDPLSLRYYHLRDEEYAVLKMLDGSASLEEMKAMFARQFAPR